MASYFKVLFSDYTNYATDFNLSKESSTVFQSLSNEFIWRGPIYINYYFKLQQSYIINDTKNLYLKSTVYIYTMLITFFYFPLIPILFSRFMIGYQFNSDQFVLSSKLSDPYLFDYCFH